MPPTDFSQLDPYDSGTNLDGSGSDLYLDWPDSRNTMVYEDPSDPEDSAWGGIIWSTVQIHAEENTYLYGAQSTEDAAAQLEGPDTVYEQDGTIPFKVTGPKPYTLSLQYTEWIEDSPYYFESSDTDPAGLWDVTTSDEQVLHVVIDWGTIDSAGDRAFIHVYFDVSCEVALGDVFQDLSDFPPSTVCSELLGTSTPEDYVGGVINALQTQVNNGSLSLKGAQPEYLILYDLSAADSVDPDLLSAGLYSVPINATDAQAFQAFATAVNQYDAGLAYGLPTRGSIPPPPIPFLHTPGGNSCGVVSLRLALNWADATTLDPTVIYANVMTPNGLTTGDNVTNAYDWWAAQDWIDGKSRHDTGKPFTQSVGLPQGARCKLWSDTSTQKISNDWKQIDTVLSWGLYDLLLRTDLSVGNTAGGGHVILLVGEGHSDYVAQAYGTSGDYYVVADPAGHYFANTNGTHYGQLQYLMNQNIAINQGGWYAIYPKELLQKRISAKGAVRFMAEGINVPAEILQIDVGSPATLLVTDGLNDWTGLQTNGTTIADIPNSAYDAEWADEEEDGTGGYVTDGIKTVFVDPPQAGRYSAQLTGTGSGVVTLDWNESGGKNNFSGTVSNVMTVGQQVNYDLGVVPPNLAISAAVGRKIVLMWPTNITGLTLQSETSAVANGWLPISNAPNVIGGQFVLTNNISGPAAFFRLVTTN